MTDQQLQLALVKMLPEKIEYDERFERFHWKTDNGNGVIWPEIQFTEWLHVCHLVERDIKIISLDERDKYLQVLASITQEGRMATVGWTNTTATWQQRAQALCKVKGIEL